MQRVCPNCGDPVDQDEIFCDKCGTRVVPDAGGPPQYQTPTPNPYQNQYQTNTPDPYQNQYQATTPNAYQNQNSYIPGQQQNTPPYTPPQSYTPPYAPYQKPKTGSKVLKIVFITISAISIILVALGIIGMLTDDKDDNKAVISSKPATSEVSKPAVSEAKKPVENNTNKPAESKNNTSGQMLVTWDGNIDINANYNTTEKKIYVDYVLILKNIGKGNAQNINVYLDPDPNDENSKYLGINPRTIVNYDGIIKQINQGSQQEIKTKFFYSNIEASKATQNNLQDIANRYLKLPVLIEWEENGKKYTDRKVPN